jgi:hypothetical protein
MRPAHKHGGEGSSIILQEKSNTCIMAWLVIGSLRRSWLRLTMAGLPQPPRIVP